MRLIVHPNLDSVQLPAALGAMADPVRLGVIAILSDGMARGSGQLLEREPSVPKSTLSNHLGVLRMAGLLITRQAGRERFHSLRRLEFESRFPGLLSAVLRVGDARST